LVAIEKAKADKEAHGEFESEHPGYCVAQDTFYVGTLKGVGRIYQQTAVDTYSKVGFAKLYDRKTALTAAELLNDRVIPFFDEHGLRIDRVLTDRGTEYCGAHDRHEYELYLAVEDIDHTRTRTKSPQTTDEFEQPLSAIRANFPLRMGDRVAKSGAWRRKPRRAAYGRSSFAASMRARRGPFGCHPLVRRSYAASPSAA
jgi:hypothetical protein